MSYQLVLWDFDGTLADTLTLALQVYNQLAAEKKFKPVTDPQAVRDMNMREFLQTHGIPAHRVPFAFTRFLKEVRQQAASVPLNAGIADVVQQISERGVRQGIVSSNSTENIQRCLCGNRVDQYFEVVGGTSRIFGKESGIRAAVRKLKADTMRVLYVGDEIRDIEAARSAAVDVAAVTWGLNSARALRSHEPDHLITSPGQLLHLL